GRCAGDARRADRAQPARSVDQQLPCRLRRDGADDLAGADAPDVAAASAPGDGLEHGNRPRRRARRGGAGARARMKHAPVDAAPIPLAVDRRSGAVVADYVALTKPRLNFLVVATSAAGYYLGASGTIDGAAMAEAV